MPLHCPGSYQEDVMRKTTLIALQNENAVGAYWTSGGNKMTLKTLVFEVSA